MTSKKQVISVKCRSKSSVPSLQYEPENSDVNKICFAK